MTGLVILLEVGLCLDSFAVCPVTGIVCEGTATGEVAGVREVQRGSFQEVVQHDVALFDVLVDVEALDVLEPWDESVNTVEFAEVFSRPLTQSFRPVRCSNIICRKYVSLNMFLQTTSIIGIAYCPLLS